MPLKVYRSSAGSGKTTTLVNEYLEMLMKPNGNFKAILAITFTNKAAGEMKERILKALGDIANCEDPSRLNPSLARQISELQKIYQLQFSDIKDKAARQLSQILHQYGSFSVSTIDKFTHQLIRSFAFDLKVPSNFVVELDTDLVVKTAVNHLLEDIGQNELVTVMLVEFMLERIDEERNVRVENDLVTLGKKLYSESGLSRLPYLANLSAEQLTDLRAALFVEIKSLEKKIESMALAIIDFIKKSDLLPEDFSYGKSGYYGALLKISKSDFSGFDSSRFRQGVEEGIFYSKSLPAAVKEKFYAIESALQKKSAELNDTWNKENSRYFLLKIILRNFYSLALLRQIKNSIDEHRKSEGILPIAEFNHIISQAIAREPAPFIYERIGNRYAELCIDEFQDTSVKQWENLMPLAEHILSLDGTVLLVGDSKQSIYRFRGGDANQLNALPTILNKEMEWMDEREFLFRQHFLPRTLNYNYRSKSEVIDFNNSFFRHVISSSLSGGKQDFPAGSLDKLAITYSDVEQECGKKKSGGSVRIQILPEMKGSLSDEKMEARNLALKKQIDYYCTLGFRWKDITILTRGNQEAGSFAAGLLAQGINVISRESVRVKESFKVGLLMDAIRWFVDSSNEPARLNVLNYLSLQSNGQAIPHQFFQEDERWKNFLEKENHRWAPDDWNYLPLPALLKRMMDFFHFQSDHDVFLSFFLEAVVKFYHKGKGDVHEFIQWWNDHSDNLNIVIPEGIDAVQIMTVHKSKGLQFKIVILPMADWSTNIRPNHKHWITLNPDESFGLSLAVADHSKDLLETEFADVYREENYQNLLDNLNLFYVAFTRAEEHLSLLLLEKSKSALYEWLNSYLAESSMFMEQDGIWVYGQPEIHQITSRLSAEEKEENHRNNFPKRDLVLDYQWAFPDETEEIESLELGLLVHALFSKVKSKADLEVSSKQLLMLNPVWKEKIIEMVNWLKAEDLLLPMWDEHFSVKNEQDILLPGGKSARPDRLMLSGKKARIFDYKTGRKRQAHSSQLRDYSLVLSEMGFEVEMAALIYVENKEVVFLNE